MKCIRILFSGGLGNQLYQYAFVQYLKRKGMDVEPDFCEFTYYAFHNGLELNKVLHTEYDDEILSIEKSRRLWYKLFSKKVGFWLRYHYYRLKNKNQGNLVYEDDTKKYDIDVDLFKEHTILKGHWQCLKYVDEVKDIFRNNLNLDLLSTYKDEGILDRIRNTDSVSIHIRRGDYLKEAQYLVIKDFDYYKRAISLIKRKVPDAFFYVFSDDMPWAKENIKEENVVYVDYNVGKDSFKDMLLMSQCRHNIIANSTFSWWGAYLNSNPSKIVVCPDHWLINELTADRVPNDWIKLEV